MTDLVQKHCVPCEGGIPPLKGDEITPFLKQLNPAWKLADDETKISREFTFSDFVQTMVFANTIADLAETEGHHPDLHVSYGKLVVELWTHKIGGLFDNDFILAAKIDEAYPFTQRHSA